MAGSGAGGTGSGRALIRVRWFGLTTLSCTNLSSGLRRLGRGGRGGVTGRGTAFTCERRGGGTVRCFLAGGDGGPDVGNGIGGERRGVALLLGEDSRLVWLFSGSIRRRGCFALDPAVVT